MKKTSPSLVKNMHSLWPWIKPQAKLLGGGLVAIAMAASMVLAISHTVKLVVDQALAQNNATRFNELTLYLFIAVAVLAASSACRVWLLNLASERVVQQVRQKLVAHLLGLDAAWHNQHPAHDLQSRFAADISLVQTLLNNALPLGVRNIFLIVGGGVLMAKSSGYLSLLLLCMLPLVMLPLIILGPALRQKSTNMQQTQSAANGLVFETLQAVREVQALGGVAQQLQRLQKLVAHNVQAAMAYAARRASVAAAMIFVVFSLLLVLLRLGGQQVIEGHMTAGALTAFVVNAVLVASSLAALSEIYADLQRATGAAMRLQELFAATNLLPLGQNLPVPQQATIQFKHVGFAYPDQPDNAVLGDIDFNITHGQMVALVGPSGGGKSTIFQLLLRFFDATQGQILVGDVPLPQLDITAWRAQLGYVPQKPEDLTLTIQDYLTLGLDDKTDVTQALEQSQSTDIVAHLPQGLQTLVGPAGQSLSGGQWQRLAIARAMVRNPKLLLLDEATAHLDTANEQALQQALKIARRQGQTLLVIAHRLSTVIDADNIVVIDNGRSVAQGTHTQLLQTSVLYQKLFHS